MPSALLAAAVTLNTWPFVVLAVSVAFVIIGISFAIVASTYTLSLPIFFDSMFMLMLPIAMAMTMRTGKNFTLYVLSICAGGVVTHSLCVPHPGPLFMVENLKVDVGLSIWV